MSMYMFKKEYSDISSDDRILDGLYLATLEDIEETISKGGNRMFKLSWKLSGNREEDRLIYDYILLEHEKEKVVKMAKRKLTAMADAMIKDNNNDTVNIFDCLHKKANIVIKNELNPNGKYYPKIIDFAKKNFKEFNSIETSDLSLSSDKNNKKTHNVIKEDDIPWDNFV